jgi:hypothetical protein
VSEPIKKLLRSSEIHKKLILDGYIIVFFVGITAEMVNENGEDWFPSGSQLKELDVMFLHIAYQSQNAWRTSWHFLEARGQGDRYLGDVVRFGVTLHSMLRAAGHWRALKELDKDRKWWLYFLEAKKTGEVLGEFVPNCFDTEPLSYNLDEDFHGEIQKPHLVWDPYSAAAAGAGWHDIHDVGGGDDAEDQERDAEGEDGGDSDRFPDPNQLNRPVRLGDDEPLIDVDGPGSGARLEAPEGIVADGDLNEPNFAEVLDNDDGPFHGEEQAGQMQDIDGPILPGDAPVQPQEEEDAGGWVRPDHIVRIKFHQHSIVYYCKTQTLVAECKHPPHLLTLLCRKTKIARRHKIESMNNDATGRPLGFLCSWLKKGCGFSFADLHRDGCVPLMRNDALREQS